MQWQAWSSIVTEVDLVRLAVKSWRRVFMVSLYSSGCFITVLLFTSCQHSRKELCFLLFLHNSPSHSKGQEAGPITARCYTAAPCKSQGCRLHGSCIGTDILADRLTDRPTDILTDTCKLMAASTSSTTQASSYGSRSASNLSCCIMPISAETHSPRPYGARFLQQKGGFSVCLTELKQGE